MRCCSRSPRRARTRRWLARAVRLPDYVHVYFHDTDLLDRRRSLALGVALRVLARRRPVRDLDELSRASAP